MNLEILLILFYSGELSDLLEIIPSSDWSNMKTKAFILVKSLENGFNVLAQRQISFEDRLR